MAQKVDLCREICYSSAAKLTLEESRKIKGKISKFLFQSHFYRTEKATKMQHSLVMLQLVLFVRFCGLPPAPTKYIDYITITA